MSKMSFRLLAALTLLVSFAFFPFPKVQDVAAQEEGDPAVLAKMHQINENLRAMGLNIAIEEIHPISFGQGRPANRIHQSGLRWVAGDPRRLADGDNITYLVDQSDGATTSGLTNAQTEAALDRALNTWDASNCLSKVDIVKRADSGADPDIFDFSSALVVLEIHSSLTLSKRAGCRRHFSTPFSDLVAPMGSSRF